MSKVLLQVPHPHVIHPSTLIIGNEAGSLYALQNWGNAIDVVKMGERIDDDDEFNLSLFTEITGLTSRQYLSCYNKEERLKIGAIPKNDLPEYKPLENICGEYILNKYRASWGIRLSFETPIGPPYDGPVMFLPQMLHYLLRLINGERGNVIKIQMTYNYFLFKPENFLDIRRKTVKSGLILPELQSHIYTLDDQHHHGIHFILTNTERKWWRMILELNPREHYLPRLLPLFYI